MALPFFWTPHAKRKSCTTGMANVELDACVQPRAKPRGYGRVAEITRKVIWGYFVLRA